MNSTEVSEMQYSAQKENSVVNTPRKYPICGIVYTLVPTILKHSLTLNQEQSLAGFK